MRMSVRTRVVHVVHEVRVERVVRVVHVCARMLVRYLGWEH